MEKMACIISNKETFCKFQDIKFLTFPVAKIEQRNLAGFQSVSPRNRWFMDNNSSVSKPRKGSKKSLNFEKRLRDHKNIIL